MPNEIANVPSIDSKATIDTTDERNAFDQIVDDSGHDEKEKGEKPEDEETEESEKTDKTDDSSDEDTEEEEKETTEEDDEEEEETESEDTVYQSLKKVDKDIFKKIPELRHVIFREAEYTKVFPSVKQAEEAREIAEVFAGYQNDLIEGNSDNLIKSLGKVDDGAALKTFLANFLPTVAKENRDLYLNMVYPEIKKVIRAAMRNHDERIINSAKNLHYFVFGDFDIENEVGLKVEKKSEREEALTKREKEFEERQYTSFHQDVVKSGEARAKKFIGQAFKNSGLSPLIERNLVNEIYTRVESAIVKDTRHMGNVQSLWLNAKKEGFTSDWKDRIITAFLSRAKLAIPKVRQEVLAEAKLSVKTDEQKGDKKVKRIPSSTTTTNQLDGRKKINPKAIDWDKTDERAALDGNFAMKK